MTHRLLAAALIFLACTGVASAYTVVLKDGRRLQVQDSYRIVNNIVVFTLSDGKRTSVSLENINVSATERANRQQSGDFQKTATGPLPIGDENTSPAQLAAAAAKRPKITRTLVNSDFGGARRRVSDPDAETAAAKKPEAEAPASRAAAVNPKETEEYWQERARPLLTEIQVQQELLNMLGNQASELERKIDRQGRSFTVLQSPSGLVVLPQTQQLTSEQLELNRVRDRMNDVRTELTRARIRYAALQEEARRLDVPPGWLR
jgi:hypothetical protein